MHLLLLAALLGCQGDSAATGPLGRSAAAVPRAEAGPSTALDRIEGLLDVTGLPFSSRPGDAEAPSSFPLHHPFELIRSEKGVSVWEARLPVRPRALFFHRALPGMNLLGPEGKRMNFQKEKNQPWTWSFTAETIIVRLPKEAGQPDPADFHFAWPDATRREAELNFHADPSATSRQDRERFVVRSAQVGPATRHGLLLPSPAQVSASVTLPTAATLAMEVGIIPPEIDEGVASDGATLVVRVLDASGAETEVFRHALQVGVFQPARVDLSAWQGQQVKLSFATEAGGNEDLDYVFVAEPVVYTPVADPKRVVMVFVDTLRRDHLGFYGYDEREVSPELDAWSKGAVVFEQARSVAPWTLPSSRTVLTGRQPELWADSFGPRIQEALAEEGWATAAFVGNIYLSSNFDMATGWGLHHCVNWPSAAEQVERAQGWLDAHPDQDALLLLHTMDMHVPYREPLPYRLRWTGPAPGDVPEGATRSAILRGLKKDPAVKDWVKGRYDQSLAYTSAQLGPFLESLGEDTIVTFFADHGEELWDHGDFEHGHTLYDELLRVPMVVKAPGLEPGRVDAPVSLLDIAPTIMALLGKESWRTDGRSLVGLAKKSAEEILFFQQRPQAFGRPLYGRERWGVLSGTLKWSILEGVERIVDIAADPAESKELALDDRFPLHNAMAAALGRPAPVSLRLLVASGGAGTFTLHHPSGLQAVWAGGDPLDSSPMTVQPPDENGSVKVQLGRASASRELYVLPNGDAADYAGLVIEGRRDTKVPDQLVLEGKQPYTGGGQTLGRGKVHGRTVTVTFAVAPVPGEGQAVGGSNAEMAAELEAIGYVERPEEEPSGKAP